MAHATTAQTIVPEEWEESALEAPAPPPRTPVPTVRAAAALPFPLPSAMLAEAMGPGDEELPDDDAASWEAPSLEPFGSEVFREEEGEADPAQEAPEPAAEDADAPTDDDLADSSAIVVYLRRAGLVEDGEAVEVVTDGEPPVRR